MTLPATRGLPCRLRRDGETDLDLAFLTRNEALDAIAAAQIEEDARGWRLSRKFQAYYLLRPFIPLRVRQWLQGNRRIEVGPRWCFPDDFVAELGMAIRQQTGPVPIIHPWPNGAPFALALTHDVETQEGLKLVEQVAALEEELGFRSSFNIVPYKYKTDKGLTRDLQARGFEIGIHGYNHDGKLYWSARTFRRRAVAINAALADYGAVGFRSPMVHRNLHWLQQLDIAYDASFFDIDPFQAMPGGIGSLWPFMAGRFVELPYTLPQDHTLLLALGQDNIRIWEDKLRFVARCSGMALMLTHPDYLDSPARLDLYRRFLCHVRELGDCWHPLPCDLARWWQDRERSRLVRDELGGWKVVGPAQDTAVPATLDAERQAVVIRPLQPAACVQS